MLVTDGDVRYFPTSVISRIKLPNYGNGVATAFPLEDKQIHDIVDGYRAWFETVSYVSCWQLLFSIAKSNRV